MTMSEAAAQQPLLLMMLLTSLLVCAAGAVEGGGGGRVIRCHAGDYELGSPAGVTCLFPLDVRVKKQGFSVVRNPGAGIDSKDRTEVLQCSWIPGEERPRCHKSSGYHFDYNVTNRLTVRIPEAREDQAGSYVCNILPAGDTQVETCRLNVTELSPKITDPSKSPPSVEKSANKTAKTDAAQDLGTVRDIDIAILILLVIVIFLIVGPVAVGFYIINRKLNELQQKVNTGVFAPADPGERTPLNLLEEGETPNGQILLDNISPKQDATKEDAGV